MGLGNMLLLSQAACYSASIILSLSVVIPMVMHSVAFKGHCSLYTTGDFIEEDGRFEPKWSKFPYCSLTLVFGALSLIASLVQLVRMSMFLYKELDSSFLSAFWDSVIAALLTVIIFVNALLVSLGFNVWCSAVTQRFPSCDTGIVMTIGRKSGIDPSGFFIELGTVQIGIWSLFICWVLALVLTGRKLFIYHERENMIVSMARERQRFVGSGRRSSGPGYMPVDYQNHI